MTIPVGIAARSSPVRSFEPALARSGIVGEVMAIVIASGGGSIEATAAIFGWIIEAMIVVVLVIPRCVIPMGRTDIATIKRT